jgi:hypothetical protein
MHDARLFEDFEWEFRADVPGRWLELELRMRVPGIIPLLSTGYRSGGIRYLAVSFFLLGDSTVWYSSQYLIIILYSQDR